MFDFFYSGTFFTIEHVSVVTVAWQNPSILLIFPFSQHTLKSLHFTLTPLCRDGY